MTKTSQPTNLNYADPSADQEEDLVKSSPEDSDQLNFAGSAPDPELVVEKDTLDTAQSMGLYSEADEEHPQELNIAEQVETAEKLHNDD